MHVQRVVCKECFVLFGSAFRKSGAVAVTAKLVFFAAQEASLTVLAF